MLRSNAGNGQKHDMEAPGQGMQDLCRGRQSGTGGPTQLNIKRKKKQLLPHSNGIQTWGQNVCQKREQGGEKGKKSNISLLGEGNVQPHDPVREGHSVGVGERTSSFNVGVEIDDVLLKQFSKKRRKGVLLSL